MIAYSRNLFIWLMLSAVALEGIADVLFKKWSIENRSWMLAAGFALYAVGTIAWAFSLRQEYLSRAVALFTVLNLAAVAMVGVTVFHEDLSYTNKIGIVLGLVSILLIES